MARFLGFFLVLTSAGLCAADITVRLTYPQPTVEARGQQQVVRVGELPLTGPPGAPRLPVESVRILLPPGSTSAEVRAAAHLIETVPGQFNLAPAGRFLPMNRPAPANYQVVPDEEIYALNEPFPAEITADARVDTFRGFPILTVNVYPVRYIPKRGRLLFSSDIQLSVTPHSTKASVAETLRAEPQDYEALVRKVLNRDQVATWLKASSSVKGTGSVLGDAGPYDYIIITDAATAPEFADLIAHKVNRGLLARSVTIEDIYANYDGRDHPEQIRNFIKDAYLNWGTDYVLLGGDTEVVPVRYAYGRVADPVEGIIEDGIPCDLYYSCLDGDWDADGDGVFGEPTEDPDLVAEVYIGRAPVEPHDPDTEVPWNQVANFTNKIIAYENAFDQPYHKRFLLVGEKLWDDPLTWGGDYKDAIADTVPSSYEVTKYYDRDGTFNSNGELIVSAINEGTHLINHMGHADTWLVAWLAEYEFYDITGDAADINNTDNFCFFYSQGCYAGAFDENGGLFGLTDECVGENLVASAHGAFGVVMNSRYGFFEPADLAASPSQQFDEEFWDAVFAEGMTRLGEANQDSKEDNLGLLAADTTGAYLWCYYDLNLLGDPETRLGGSVSREGRISLNKPAYQAGEEVRVTVMDMDLNEDRDAMDSTQVTFTCSGGDSESLVLQEVGVSTGVFTGSLSLQAASAIPANARLECQDAETITVSYHDADDGSGGSASRSAQATADFTAPQIENVQVTAITDNSATVSWETTEDCSGRIHYGTAAPLTLEGVDPDFSTSHSVTLGNLQSGTAYQFTVEVTDLAGRTVLDDNSGANYTFTTVTGIALFADDMESGPGDWEVTYQASGNPGNNWYITENWGHSGTHSWHYCAESWDTEFEMWIFNYSTSVYPVHGYLTSPIIDLRGQTAARLQFWQVLSIAGALGNTWDYAHVEINKGTGWELLQAMEDTGGVWKQVSVDLDAYVDNQVQVRFHFYCDWDVCADIYPGWFIDDVAVIAPFAGAPTDIALDNSTVPENAAVGTLVGRLSTTDPDEEETFTYTLVGGDKEAFSIIGNELRTAVSFDFETRRLYSIRIKTDDGGGGTYQESFIINVTNVNESPTDITISSSTIAENSPVGTVVGSFATVDPDAGQSFGYTLVSGTGGDDNAEFSIDGAELKCAAVFDFESRNTYSIRVRADDGAGGTCEKAFAITVTDVEELPTVTLTCDNASIAEAGATATFSAILSAPSSHTVTVDLAFSGTATHTVDYVRSGTQIVIAAGGTSGTLDVTAVQDVLDEPDETIVADIAAVTNGIESGTQQQTTTIVDDDNPPTVAFAEASSQGSENASSAELAVSLSAASGRTVTVQYSVTGGTAAGDGTDYTLAAGMLSFTPSATALSIPVSVVDDVLDEADETVIVTLSDPSHASLGAPGVHTFLITDDDPTPSLSVDDVTVTEGDTGTVSAAFTLTLSMASGRTVTVDCATADGSAAAGLDYTALPVTTSTFSAGDTSETITVQVNGDELPEGDESFVLNLSNPANVTLADARGTCTITDDDSAPVIAQGDSVAVVMDEDGDPTAWAPPALSATDADGDTLSWSLHNAPSHGSATVAGTGLSPTALEYAPAKDWHGSDSFVAAVSDGHGGTDLVTISVTVNPVSDPPAFSQPTYDFAVPVDAGNGTVVGQVVATDPDLTKAGLSYSIVSGNDNGLFAISASTGEIILADVSQRDPTSSGATLEAAVTDGEFTEIVAVAITWIPQGQHWASGNWSIRVDSNGTPGSPSCVTTWPGGSGSGNQLMVFYRFGADDIPQLWVFLTDGFWRQVTRYGEFGTSYRLFRYRASDDEDCDTCVADSFEVLGVTDQGELILSLDYHNNASAAPDRFDVGTIVLLQPPTSLESSMTAELSITNVTGEAVTPHWQGHRALAEQWTAFGLSSMFVAQNLSPLPSWYDTLDPAHDYVGNISDSDPMNDAWSVNGSIYVSSHDVYRITAGTADLVLNHEPSSCPPVEVPAYEWYDQLVLVDQSATEISLAHAYDPARRQTVELLDASGLVDSAADLEWAVTYNRTDTNLVDGDNVQVKLGLDGPVDSWPSGASQTITVALTTGPADENDPPVVGNQIFSVREDSTAGTLVGTVEATDADQPPQALSFEIVAGNDGGAFSLDESSGALTLASPVDYEAVDTYVLTVQVTDDGSPPRSATATCTVSVTDVNDVPVITGQAGSLQTRTGEDLEILLAHLLVTDPDNTWPDDFSLSIQDGDNYSVEGAVISPAAGFTGALTVPVTVSDGLAQSAAFDLTVQVLNKNVPVVSWSDPEAVVYGQALGETQLDATADTAGTFNYSPPAGTVLPAGDHVLQVTFVPEDEVNWASTDATVQLTVTKAPLTITADDASRAVGDPNPAFTCTASGFVAGDSLATIGLVVSYDCPADETSGAGSYPIVPSGPETAGSYSVSYLSGTLTVTPPAGGYELSYTAGPHGAVVGETAQTVDSGADGSPVTAVPDPAHRFMQWSDGRTDNPRVDTNVNADVTVIAEFGPKPHDVDQNGDWQIQLSPELTRLVQFFNAGGYHCAPGSEDGYAPGPGDQSGRPHDADQNGDWQIQLSPELTRVVQFYNAGGCHCEEGTEDGYAPGRTSTAADGFVLIEAGGSSGTDPDFGDYSLNVDPIALAMYEVTLAEWDDVRDWAVSNGYPDLPEAGGKGAEHPVHSVSWYDAVKWCNARSEKEGLVPCYTVAGHVYRTGISDEVMCDFSCSGYRLPTSTEWEYSARGGSDGQRFPWGSVITHEDANYFSDPSYAYDQSLTRGYHPDADDGVTPYTSAVGSFAANGYGVHEMIGNVREWCWNWHPESVGVDRVVRGGSWEARASSCRIGYQDALAPEVRDDSCGFRVCRSAGAD